ncbi:UDP-N-acetylmuramate dehydrogenase [Betaproteobacteria bacterium]|nr:UDP-N-acetylmuramate dehydrogenase [Betaproteobacteria bacterium]
MTQNIFNLKRFNTLGLNAYCRNLEIIEKERDVKTLIKDSKNKFIILGEGSNVILDAPIESPFKVPVFINKLKGITVQKNPNQRVIVRCGAGENWNEFVLWTLKNKYRGLECLAGIPGSVGAAPIQNIGAYGSEVCDVIESVHAYDVNRNLAVNISNKDCAFGYRTSVFKNQTSRSSLSNFVILSVEFSLSADWKNFKTPDYASVKNILPSNPTGFEIAEAVQNIRKKKLPDLTAFPNVGSFFINPVIDNARAERLRSKFSNIPIMTFNGYFKLSAAWLIESCGFRGAKFKNVGMHLKHALVLVNYRDSSSEDILLFAEKVKASVKEKFDVNLKIEPVILSSSEKS